MNSQARVKTIIISSLIFIRRDTQVGNKLLGTKTFISQRSSTSLTRKEFLANHNEIMLTESNCGILHLVRVQLALRAGQFTQLSIERDTVASDFVTPT